MESNEIKLTVYRNLDPKQPQVFTGRKREAILKRLSRWMDDNNGDWCDRRGQRPCQVDGLTIFTEDDHWDEGLPITYSGTTLVCEENPDGCPEADWSIEWWSKSVRDGPLDVDEHGSWMQARDAFVRHADYWGEWEGPRTRKEFEYEFDQMIEPFG